MKYYIGIDPGRSGAVAAIDENKNICMVHDWPNLSVKGVAKGNSKVKRIQHLDQEAGFMIDQVNSFVKKVYTPDEPNVFCALEKVHAFSMREGRNVGMKSTGDFMTAYGIWIGILSFWFSGNLEFVHPRTWQARIFGRLPKGTNTKEKSLLVARTVFGERVRSLLARKKDNGRSDALLIALWLRNEKRQKLF